MPIRRRRRAGQLIRAAAISGRSSPRPLVWFGAIYVPIVVLVALLGALIAVIPVLKEIQGLAGARSGTRVLLALLAGSVPHVIGYTAVNAMVATYAEAISSGQARSSSECARLVWQRRRELVSGLARAMVIVVVLIVSVIGIPWGIRQLVRYQFMPQAVMLEDLDGRRGLARSTELVSGRWWHTAVVIGSFNGLFVIIGLVFSLLLLLLLPSMPLWLFSAAVALINGLVVPFVAVAQTLLYGDAVVEHEATEDRELVTA
jgi:hypothetical protein